MRSKRMLVLPCLLAGLYLLGQGPDHSNAVSSHSSNHPFAHKVSSHMNPLNRRHWKMRLNQMPLRFEPNQGQSARQVRFLSRGAGYTLFLTSNEAVLALQRPGKPVGTRGALPRHGVLWSRSRPAAIYQPLLSSPTVANRVNAQQGKSLNARYSPHAPLKEAVVRMQLVGANPDPGITGVNKLTAKSNYFVGNNPKAWHTNIQNYARVNYHNVYPGVDLTYYGRQGRLEYDFVVNPGASPSSIRLALVSESSYAPLTVDDHGNLVVPTSAGEVRFHKPLVYQKVSGRSPSESVRRILDGKYVLRGKHEVSFQLASYNHSKPLVIDPAISYSTYLGGSGYDLAKGIAVDPRGNVYVTGWTTSTDFPLVNPLPAPNNALHGSTNGLGIQDAFVSKLSFSGSTLKLDYSTYLGSDGSTIGTAIAVDRAGHAYVTGRTDAGFPLLDTLFPSGQGFVTKLNSAGNAIVYSTLFGGSGITEANAIAVDLAGNAIVTGDTYSADFPSVNSLPSAFQPPVPPQSIYLLNPATFVSKFQSAGSRLSLANSTLLGGTGTNEGLGIAVDSAGNAYVAGVASGDFPTQFPLPYSISQAATSGFVAKLNFSRARMRLVFSTLIGGSDFGGGAETYDAATGIAVDPAGNVYVTGNTQAELFPYVNQLPPDELSPQRIFVSKLHFSGSALTFVYFTTMEGSESVGSPGLGAVFANPRIAVDYTGNAYVSGASSDANYPMINPLPAPNNALRGPTDAFVRKLSFSRSGLRLTLSTFFGGSGDDGAVGIGLDPGGNIYVAGITDSTDLPTVHPLPAPNNAKQGPEDAFVVKLQQ